LQRNAIQAFQTSLGALSMLTRMSFAHLFMYARLHNAVSGLEAIAAAGDDGGLITPEVIRSDERLARIDKSAFWSRSYAGQWNLFQACGEFSAVRPVITQLSNKSVPLLAVWPWDFADSVPALTDASTMDEETLEVKLYRLKFAHADAEINRRLEAGASHQDTLRYALFSWSRGAFDPAQVMIRAALEREPADISAERQAYDAMAAALLVMADRTRHEASLTLLSQISDRVQDPRLRAELAALAAQREPVA
jgi:hypothetical protein